LRLYGTVTSPFVRRVRVVADELAIPFELVDAFTDEGQRQLRESSPLWKVPSAQIEGRVVWDSALILEALLEPRGYKPFRRPSLDERMFIAAVDEGLLALVRRFYLERDGVDVSAPASLVKDRARVTSILAYIEDRLVGGACTDEGSFGLAELALYTGLDWMRFRATWPVEEHPRLMAFLAVHQGRPSLVATAPSA
jgi:glutathione S-transferase